MRRNKLRVSERALLQRLNRALAKDGEVLKKARPSRYRKELGDFFVLSRRANGVIEGHVNIEALARQKGVLARWEVLEPGVPVRA